MSRQSDLQPLSGQRQDKETDAAVTACNDFLRLGSGRSISGLVQKYTDMSMFQTDFKPPSTSAQTLYSWSSRFDWADRAAVYDAAWEERKNAEREAVLNYGLALDYERLRELYRLADLLRGQIYERNPESGVFDNIWLPDVKSIGSGESAERVDIERFNAALVEQYRKVLEDIAKEVGGRVNKTDLTSDGKPIAIGITKMDVDEL